MSRTTEDRRKTVSLAKVVWDMAEQNMKDRGFNDNFSAYIADLIRRDKEREDEKRPSPSDKSSSSTSRYPSPQPQLNEVHDKPAPKKRKAA
jgi:hypothetical protein